MSHHDSQTATVKTTIDGREIEVRRDRWALEVARELDIEIPTLCYHPALEPYGACRLCVVEVTRGRWTWLTTSCDLPIREGLSIRTDTESVRKARRLALELLWAQAPQSQEIADLARRMGVDKPRFSPRDPDNSCILCGLCVRVCEKVTEGRPAIGFARRGVERSVSSPFDDASEQCVGCQACVTVCPTGHIRCTDQSGVRHMRTWQTDLELQRCEQCGKTLAPAAHLHQLRSRLSEHVPLASLCPSCRRRESARALTHTKPNQAAHAAGDRRGSRKDKTGEPATCLEK